MTRPSRAGLSTVIHKRHPRGDKPYCGARGIVRLSDHRAAVTCERCEGWRVAKRK